ncbi:ATP-grasp fold amidoligase family protein [Blastococcus xanthinilyticus]|uniref:ATP-grasp fold amidoligase family protein n=1 Tax=Blastococcus xanthinilyticus TaxID=1564164 RepID=UPI003C7EBD57
MHDHVVGRQQQERGGRDVEDPAEIGRGQLLGHAHLPAPAPAGRAPAVSPIGAAPRSGDGGAPVPALGSEEGGSGGYRAGRGGDEGPDAGRAPVPARRLRPRGGLPAGRASDFIRVDLYDVDGEVWFGELTPCPGGGPDPFDPELDRVLGRYWTLPRRADVRAR